MLDGLAERELVRRLERRPGQKEQRYRHLLDGEEDAAEALAPATSAVADGSPEAPAGSTSSRLDALERKASALRAELAELRSQLGG